MSYSVVLVTAPNIGEARHLAKLLLEKRLCACVNIVRGIESFFWWKSKIDKAGEFLLMVKTKKSLVSRLIRTVRAAHSYEVCEVIALPVAAGNEDYLAWIDASCRRGKR